MEENNIRIDLYNMDNTQTEHLLEVAERIKKHESPFGKGILKPYQLEYKGVKEDFFTVGHGHRIYGEVKESYSQEEIDTLFEDDFKKAMTGAMELIGNNHPPEVLGVVTEMVFQLGYNGTSKFKKTLKHINNNEYTLASTEMMDSNWAKQTTERAESLSAIMGNIK